MCGVNGFTKSDKERINSMNQSTRHRGPDGEGFFVDDFVSLGHNLLAILERPENSRQPMETRDGNFILVYNGEIYNYRELRSSLTKKGEIFLTDSDTEVVLKGLARYGAEFLHNLDGMFALALYDKKEKTILLARDSAGMKPLYYAIQNDKFVFSSELRGLFEYGIDRKLNTEKMFIYFILGYMPGNETLIKDVYKVRPGEYVLYDLAGKGLSRHKFIQEPKNKFTEFEPRELKAKIHDSVLRHTMGLRPFGLYLSGGLDSTVILHELASKIPEKIKTYTTRFDTKDKSLNEDADRAQRLTKEYNIEHNELLVTEEDFIDATEKCIETVEEPRYNFSMPAYWLLAKYASRDITVVLNGSGGDELFMGYDRYGESQKLSKRYERYPDIFVDLWHTASALKKGDIKLGQFARLNNPCNRWAYLNKIISRWGGASYLDAAKYIKFLEGKNAEKKGSEEAIAYLDRKLWLADEEFIRTDKISMHFGMEGRFPFLAREIVEYSDSIPSEVKLAGGTKALVRQSYKGKLPDYIIDKKKTGWYAPVVEWMESDYGNMVREVLSAGYYRETADLLDTERIRSCYVDRAGDFSRGNIKRFLPFVAFQIWAKKFDIKI